jgi:hypothetical protein
MLGVVLIVGVVFGLVAMSSYQNRQLYQLRTRDASRVADALQKRVETFDEIQTIVGNLDPSRVEYEKAKKLGELDLTLSSTAIGTQRLLLGGERTMLLTSFMVDAEQLTKLLKRHDRYTNSVDKEALQRLMGDGDRQAKKQSKTYGVIFDLDHLLGGMEKRQVPEGFKPKFGKLVEVENFDNPKDGKVEYHFLNSQRKRQADIRSIVPLKKSELKTSSGPNALERYQERIGRIKTMVKKLEGRPDSILTKIEKLSKRPAPPLIQL